MRRFAVLVAALGGLLPIAAPAGAAQTKAKAHDAIVVINGQVSVQRGETADGVFVVHGDARIAGRVDGDVTILSGDALVSGRIDGDLLTIGGRARLLRTATVTGDVRYGDKRPQISPGAKVGGEVVKESWSDSLGLLPWLGAFVLWLSMSISSLVLGILLLLIAPRAADAVFERARAQIGPAIAIGIAIAIVLPLTALVSAVTIFGLPLAVGIVLALLPLAAIAYVTAAWALGRTIVKPPRERILSFLAGLAILRVAALLPILGLLTWLAAVVVGLGLIGAAIGAARERTVAAS